MKNTIGTCSLCGGPVTVPTVYHSVVPPTPRCEGCGAVPVASHGPVIAMRKAPWPESSQFFEGYRQPQTLEELPGYFTCKGWP